MGKKLKTCYNYDCDDFTEDVMDDSNCCCFFDATLCPNVILDDKPVYKTPIAIGKLME